MKKKLMVVLPAFNEEKVIGKVLLKLKTVLRQLESWQTQKVVVDDGSADKTSVVSQKYGALVLKHHINRGLGGALFTGFQFARLKKVDFLITMDSDGQHEPADIIKILKSLSEDKADIVIGARNIFMMPTDRKIITFLSSLLTFLLFGVWCSDTQSGFRGFNKKAIDKIEIKTQRMEVSSEFFSEIKRNKLKFIEVPIKVIYTSYSRQKGQSNLNSLKVFLKLLLRLAR